MNIGVYRIFNIERSMEGEPFFMCDSCYKAWRDDVGYKFIVNKLGENSTRSCEGYGGGRCTDGLHPENDQWTADNTSAEAKENE